MSESSRAGRAARGAWTLRVVRRRREVPATHLARARRVARTLPASLAGVDVSTKFDGSGTSVRF
jgi:hypothetical protein